MFAAFGFIFKVFEEQMVTERDMMVGDTHDTEKLAQSNEDYAPNISLPTDGEATKP